jgi:Flp pilus assembly protein TadG
LRRGKEEGTGIVEFAFIVILLLLILFGIMGFGQALYAYHFVNHAAKDATRWAAVNGASCGLDSSCNGSGNMNNGTATAANISTYVQNHVPSGITSANVTTTATWPAQTNSPTICSAAVGTQPKTPNYPGCTVQVTVSYPYVFAFPLLPAPKTTAPCTTPGICMSSTSDLIIVH